MVEVHLGSGAISYNFVEFNTYEEAVAFCLIHDWAWFDENGYEWEMFINE